MSPELNISNRDNFKTILGWLDSSKASYKVIEHPEIDGTASGSSVTTRTRPEQGAKALIMMVSGERPIMVVLRGPDRADFKAIKKAVGSDDIRLASQEEIKKITPLEVGTLPPFGNLLDLTTYVDQLLLNEEELACGTGLATKTIILKTDDFKRAVNPIVGNFVKR